MKRCPTCQRTYTDAAQVFCADDGTPLREDNAAANDLQKTLLASGPPNFTPPGQQSPSSWPPPAGGQQAPPHPGAGSQQQQPGWGAPPQQPYGQQQQYGQQQPYGQPPPGQQWGGYYQQPGAYTAAAGGRKGLSIAALILGALSAVGAVLLLSGIIRRYNYSSSYSGYSLYPSDEFMIGSIMTGVLGGLALLLGAVALIFAITKAQRWQGKGPAAIGLILGLVGGLTATVLGTTTSTRSYTSTYASNSNNSNGSTSYSNRNGSSTTYSSNANDNSSDHNMNDSTSASTMTEDEKYRIFYAAGKTNDKELQKEIAILIGIIDDKGVPTSYYQPFVTGSFNWASRDSSFPPTVDTPEKAHAYVMAHK
jgi:hypothetical protein